MAPVIHRFLLLLLSAIIPPSSPVSLATFDQRQPSASSAFHPKDTASSSYKSREDFTAVDAIFPRFSPGETLPAENVAGGFPGEVPEAAFYKEGMPRSNITAIEGREIQLPCKVVHLGNKTVSGDATRFPVCRFFKMFVRQIVVVALKLCVLAIMSL